MAVKTKVIGSERIPPEKIDVIHNGIDLTLFDEIEPVELNSIYPEISNTNKVIGMVANFNRQVKRVDLFIMAAAKVIEEHKNVRFLIIGGGNLENELKKLIHKLHLNNIVILGGARESANPFIKRFNIGVLTSDSEGFSNVLLEYMAAGIPVVATEVGGNREIICNDHIGSLVPMDDHYALAAELCKLLSDENRCKSMGWAARKYVSENYSWKTKSKEIERYYEAVLNRGYGT